MTGPRSSRATGVDTAVVVQATDTGVRALVDIESDDAPERFDFPIGGDVTSLRPAADGRVEALNADGLVVATAETPWATDANSVPLPTHYEINGTTLVQVVEHHARDYSYPVVADPWWNPFSWPWGKWVKKAVPVIKSALKKCGVGALATTLGLGAGTATMNILIEKFSTYAKVKVAGGPWAYVGTAVGGCIAGQLT